MAIKNMKLKKWYSSSMKNSTFLLVSTIVIVFSIVFIVATSFNHYRTKLDDLYSQNEKISNTVINNIDNYMDTVAAILNDANYNYYLQDYLNKAVENGKVVDKLKPGANVEYNRISSKIFDQYISGRTDISSIMVFCNNSLLLSRSIYDYWSYILDYTSLDWYKNAVEDPSSYSITGPMHHPFLLGNTERTISLSKSIISSFDGSFLGVILVDINLNEIQKICSSTYTNRDSILYIMNEKGSPIYEYNPFPELKSDIFDNDYNKEYLSSQIEKNNNNFSIKLNGEFYYLSLNTDKESGWRFVTLYPRSKLMREVFSFSLTLILLLLLSLSIVIYILNHTLSNIIHPISEITDNMDQLDSLENQITLDVKYEDERGKLLDSFNSMIKRINLLTEQVREEENEKRKYELQALHSQINPHFLYNTLDTIVWMAELQDDRIVEVTESLATLFRISLNKGTEFISIYQELEHVRNYLFIQQQRYGEKLSYSIEFDPTLRNVKIIKLIVQPLVENSIYHGIKMKEGKGHINITVNIINEIIEINVKDDGIGMDKEHCEKILENNYSGSKMSKGTGVGVKNVNKRLKLYYGEEYGIEYSSVIGEGTIATIRIPLEIALVNTDNEEVINENS